ncbi:MAG TPA: phosphate ABC transporter permease subunit PstC [bacterium]|nr:phosphate ABC transporter permease subunit PstC [bacterium]
MLRPSTAGKGGSTALLPPTSGIARSRRALADAAFRSLLTGFGLSVIVLVAGMAAQLTQAAMPAIRHFGAAFLWTSRWDPVHNIFGALPFAYGTVASSLLALLLAVPVSLGVAIYLAEIAPAGVSTVLSFVIELLAAIPSVILGLWGIFVLAPWLRASVEVRLGAVLGWFPLFSGPTYGIGLLAGGVILAIMVVPIISSVSREVLKAVPVSQREAMYALGATRWEVIRRAVLPYGRTGIIGAIILGLGRALGETMAVTMVIGNRPQISPSLFQPAYTIAAALANEFTEATTDLYVSALIEMAVVLFIITLLTNAIARWLIWRVARTAPGVSR